MIALPYGVEGFASTKHLIKEDGKMAEVDEKLPFKVIEFNKTAKRIVLSHSKIHEELKKAEEPTKPSSSSKKSKKAKPEIEKTTLGDITELAALKTEMEEKSRKKSTKKEE